MELTSSSQEYLKTIYIIETTEKQVRVTDIAKKLGITKPSVNRALNVLKEEKLVIYEAYGNIKLTKKGIDVAKSIIKRYDILKVFLTGVLGVDENIAEGEATSMKNSVSEKTAVKLEKYINDILNLDCCDFDKDSQKCKTCVKNTAKNRLTKKGE